ncbi:MAG: hypothetical protein ABS79_00955 [Planctomycetes bacterium SCN 63-9]|nr:MAG: hypothetical protein ABS79_00955 [Planctomycetes bacterium SCN 63-9]
MKTKGAATCDGCAVLRGDESGTPLPCWTPSDAGSPFARSFWLAVRLSLISAIVFLLSEMVMRSD